MARATRARAYAHSLPLAYVYPFNHALPYVFIHTPALHLPFSHAYPHALCPHIFLTIANPHTIAILAPYLRRNAPKYTLRRSNAAARPFCAVLRQLNALRWPAIAILRFTGRLNALLALICHFELYLLPAYPPTPRTLMHERLLQLAVSKQPKSIAAT